MTDDTIYRQAAIEALYDWELSYTWDEHCKEDYDSPYIVSPSKVIDGLPSAQQWIPVKTRPMTQEEREYYELHWDVVLDDEEAVLFDCPMPEDKQTIWVTTKNGYLFQDTCENDDGYIGLEGNGDWYDIVAWMPVLVPEPYKEGKDDEG